MAQKTTTLLIDDLDGSTIDEGAGGTVTFGLDGKRYEIDLTAENAANLRDSLTSFIKAGRRLSGDVRVGKRRR